MTPLLKIKINVGYNRILAYDNLNNPIIFESNIQEMNDFQPDHTRTLDAKDIEKKFDITFPIYNINNLNNSELLKEVYKFDYGNFYTHFDNSFGTFNNGIVKEFNDKNIPYIYPIVLFDNNLFNGRLLNLSNDVLESISKNLCKIVIVQPTEGVIFDNFNNFTWIYNLVKKYSIPKNNIVVLSANLIADDRYKQYIYKNNLNDFLTVYCFNHFEHNLWFVNRTEFEIVNKIRMYQMLCDSIDKNRRFIKKKHFLCFNRRPKEHRIAIFSEIKTNINLVNKSIVTLGGYIDNIVPNYVQAIKNYVRDDYKFGKEKLINYVKNLDPTIHHTYDEADLENNKASNINFIEHNNTFLNIVTESSTISEIIFFSEKTFKPVYACQPFIIFGNPNSLKKLKELGYKTFDKWWDESYDDELNFTRRLEKIIDVMNEISTWSLDKCFNVTNEMESVLVHNFNKLTSDDEMIKLYNFLSDFDNNTDNIFAINKMKLI